MTLKVWSFGALTLLAFGAGSCSDPVPAAARGNFAFTITTCQQYTGGVAKNGNVPTNTYAGDRYVDGENNTSISCTVSGGPPFNIRGRINGNNNSPRATQTGEHIEMTISNGQIVSDPNTGAGTGTADMTLYAGQVWKNASGMPCTLAITPGTDMEVAKGRVYASFNCASNLENPPAAGCSAQGVFVFERCGD